MEQPPINPSQQPNTQPSPALDHTLRSYFLQQGQGITRLYELLRSNIVAFGFKAFLSIVFQIFCYLLFAFAIYLAISIPTDLPGIILLLDENISVEFIPRIEGLADIFFAFKIIIAVMAIPILVCALLLGRNRRKSALIRKSFNETELMKQNFEQALKEFRF